jgi:hypothetical protein
MFVCCADPKSTDLCNLQSFSSGFNTAILLLDPDMIFLKHFLH